MAVSFWIQALDHLYFFLLQLFFPTATRLCRGVGERAGINFNTHYFHCGIALFLIFIVF